MTTVCRFAELLIVSISICNHFFYDYERSVTLAKSALLSAIRSS